MPLEESPLCLNFYSQFWSIMYGSKGAIENSRMKEKYCKDRHKEIALQVYIKGQKQANWTTSLAKLSKYPASHLSTPVHGSLLVKKCKLL